MNSRRPLPLGRTEFEEWSDRIIAGAMLAAGPEGTDALRIGQKFALADMLMHIAPTESHKEDAFFIHSLRNTAVRQVAHSMRAEYQKIGKAKNAEMELKVLAEIEAEIELAKTEDREPLALTEFQQAVVNGVKQREAAEALKAKAQVSTPPESELKTA